MSGFVYLIESAGGLFKIGFTKNDPRRRIAMLRTGNAEALTLLGAVAGQMADEKELHRLLAPWRVTREWFLPCKAIQYLSECVTPIPAGRMLGPHPLAAARRAAGITQSDLAEAVGMDRVSIARIETGVTVPPLRTIGKIISAMEEVGTVVRVEDFAGAAA